MDLPTREIVAALKAKGFKSIQGDHERFKYPKSLQTTKVSQGKGKSIGDDLIQKMASQLRLTKQEFLQLVDCSLTEDGYRTILKTKGLYPRKQTAQAKGVKKVTKPRKGKKRKRRKR